MPVSKPFQPLARQVFPTAAQLASQSNTGNHELLPVYWLSGIVAPCISALSITTGAFFLHSLLLAVFPMALSIGMACFLVFLLEMLKHLLTTVAVRDACRKTFGRMFLLFLLLLPCYLGSAWITLQGITAYHQTFAARPMEQALPVIDLSAYEKRISTNEEAITAIREQAAATGTFHWKTIQDQLKDRLALSKQLQEERAAAEARMLAEREHIAAEQRETHAFQQEHLWAVGAVLEALLLIGLCFRAAFRWRLAAPVRPSFDESRKHAQESEKQQQEALQAKEEAIAVSLAEGETYRSIQQRLQVSPKTIARVKKKMAA